MPSTYSSLKVQLMATGENNTTWGDVTNVNLGTALEEAIVGSADVAFSNANVTLTLTDTNASQTARNMRLNLTGTATLGYNLVVPSIEKPYIINNGTDGTITVKNATGTGIAVPAGKTMWVYNDGTNVVDAVTRLSSLTLGTALVVGSGGTGANTFTSNGVLLGNGTSAISATAAGTTGQVLVGNTGGAPTWATLSTSAVTSFSAGTTGLTPNSATTGAITLAGTLAAANGGTGQSSYTVGDLLYASGATTLSKLADVATGNALISGGVGVAPSWGKIGLTTHVSGTLGVGNGGTGATTFTSNGVLYGNGTSAVSVTAAGTTGQVLVANTGGAPSWATLTGIGVTSFSAGTTGLTPSTGTTGAITLAGTLGVANGGTGATSLTSGYLVKGNGTSAASASVVYDDGTNVGIGTSSPFNRLAVVGQNEFSLGVAARTSSTQTGMLNHPVMVLQNNSNAAGNGVGLRYQIADTSGTLRTAGGFGMVATAKDASSVTADMYFYTGISERMRIDSSGNVGIGTSAPGAKLNVVDASADDAVRITQTGAGNALVVEDSANPDATPFVVDASGRVGIGRTPSNSLAILGAGNPAVDLDYYENGTGGASYRGRKARGTAGAPSAVQSGDYLSTLLASGYGDTGFGGNIGLVGFRANQTFTDTARGTNIVFENTPDGSNSRSERMRITAAGDVGIGTSSPGSPLDVQKVQNAATVIQVANTDAGASASARLVATNGTTTGGIIMRGTGTTEANYLVIYNSSTTAPVSVYTNGSERMRIDSSGNLLVGTTTSFGKLSVYGTAGFNADANSSISGSGSFKFRGVAAGTTITTYDYLNYTAMQFIRDNGNPTNTVGSITCTDTATTYNTSSDRRLKKDVAPAGDAGSVIDAIEIVSHGWKASEGTVPFGVIAQDLHAVAPQAVHAGDDGEDVTAVWGVDYSKLVPMLIKEIQSLRARVAQLEGN